MLVTFFLPDTTVTFLTDDVEVVLILGFIGFTFLEVVVDDLELTAAESPTAASSAV